MQAFKPKLLSFCISLLWLLLASFDARADFFGESPEPCRITAKAPQLQHSLETVEFGPAEVLRACCSRFNLVPDGLRAACYRVILQVPVAERNEDMPDLSSLQVSFFPYIRYDFLKSPDFVGYLFRLTPF
ncbi:hypothetical protein KJS94_05995 [Flavihumibacter rivuli]|uniref:hypothetical protein n=1 Tax=Flavihumibacter rivuli TaxID=2838156 RepID=UPI001BDE2BB0|nr:hypothetical protein [Flavihumibacter rivuli]ULQ57748.1 hypothetical protein KJS94_05995 [Flavihumibacter rivuli]